MIKSYRVFVLFLAVMLALGGCGSAPAASEPPADSASQMPSSVSQHAPVPEVEPSEHYQKLVAEKQELLMIVRTRVEEYRNDMIEPMGGHHALWQEGYPDRAALPLVVTTSQFAVRQEADIDAMGSIYLAVRIDVDHELRIDASQRQRDDGSIIWGSGNSWFSQRGDEDFDSWALSDIDLDSWKVEDIYEQAMLLYGAEYAEVDGERVMRPEVVSLYYIQEGWGEEQGIDIRMAFSWFFSSTGDEDYEYRNQAYKNPKGEDMGRFYPQDIFEARVQRFFDVTTDRLRQGVGYYDAKLEGYSVDGGGGRGEQPPIKLVTTEHEGDLHRLTYSIDFEYSEDCTMIMTIKINSDGSFRYISVLPA